MNRDRAQQLDNDVADELDGSALEWDDGNEPAADDTADNDTSGGEEEPSDEEISEGTEPTEGDDSNAGEDEEEGEEAPVEPKEPAAGKPKAPAAGVEQQTPPQIQTTQTPAGGQEASQPAPLFHEMVAQNFDSVVETIAQNPAIKLSGPEAEMFEPEVAKAIERQSAKVFVQAMAGMSRVMHETLPRVVHNIMNVGNDASRHQNEFYTNYKGFDPEKHTAGLSQVAAMVRAQSPGLDRKQLSDQVARIGYAMFGITPPKAQNGGAPKAPGQKKVVRQQAFTPAGKPGAATGQRRPAGAPVKKDPLIDVNDMLRSNVDMDD